MIGSIMPGVLFHGWDDLGNFLPGGLLYTYVGGTPSTPAVTYADEALTTPNSQPVVLSAAGRAAIYLVPGNSYHLILKSALGVTIWDQDHITGQPFATGVDTQATAGETIGAHTVVYLSAGSGGKTAGQYYLGDSANAYSSTLPSIGMTDAAIASAATGVVRTNGRVSGLSGLVAGTTYYIGTAGALTSTAPGNARRVGVADTTTSLVLETTPLPQPVVQTITLTGTQNNVVLTAGVTELRCNNASLLTITGFAAGADGQDVVIVSVGAGQVDLAHQNASSTAANRLINYATSGNTSLAAGVGTARVVYDATTARWRLVAHEQGAWITATFAAGNFTGSASMTWTVAAGDVGTMQYYLRGRALSVMWSLNTTTIGGTPSTSVLIGNGAYGGFTWAKTAFTTIVTADNGTASLAATSNTLCQITASGTNIAVFKQGGVAFTAGADNVQTHGEVFGEVN